VHASTVWGDGHADLVDQKALEKRFPVPTLQEWKRSQIADYEKVVEPGSEAGWHLTDDEAAEVVDESERSTNISLTADTIIVGGMGGQPLGAGGGGGVVGTGSLVGGKGGDVQIPKLEGEPGKFPGGWRRRRTGLRRSMDTAYGRRHRRKRVHRRGRR
jgi:hypothetical protein